MSYNIELKLATAAAALAAMLPELDAVAASFPGHAVDIPHVKAHAEQLVALMPAEAPVDANGNPMECTLHVFGSIGQYVAGGAITAVNSTVNLYYAPKAD